MGQHILVANDTGPLGKTLQLDEVVVARLRVGMQDGSLGRLLVELLALSVGASRRLPSGRSLGLGSIKCSSGSRVVSTSSWLGSLDLLCLVLLGRLLGRGCRSRVGGVLHLNVAVVGGFLGRGLGGLCLERNGK